MVALTDWSLLDQVNPKFLEVNHSLLADCEFALQFLEVNHSLLAGCKFALQFRDAVMLLYLSWFQRHLTSLTRVHRLAAVKEVFSSSVDLEHRSTVERAIHLSECALLLVLESIRVRHSVYPMLATLLTALGVSGASKHLGLEFILG